MKIGYVLGENCNRNGCGGIMETTSDGQCSCHINAPCSKCTWDEVSCSVCGECHIYGEDENWQNEINLKGNKMLKIIRINIDPEYTNTNDGKLIAKVNCCRISAVIIEPIFKNNEIKYLAYQEEVSPTKQIFDTLTDAKQHINNLIYNETLYAIQLVAEIVED